MKKLTSSDAEQIDQLGESVAISGDIAIIGAPHAGGPGDTGAAYVFRRDQGGAGNWGEVKKLLASDAQDFDSFGTSVAVSGETAVVGASEEDAEGGQNDNFGAAYVFGRDEGGAENWGEVKKLTASDAQSHDWFGYSVAVSGDTAVIGANPQDPGGIGNVDGAAYVFQRNQGGAGNWGEVTKLFDSVSAPRNFGRSVAVSANLAVVGARSDNPEGIGSASAVYVFQEISVGGIAERPDLATAPLDSPASSGASVGLLAAIVVAGGFALGGAAWFARRRWLAR